LGRSLVKLSNRNVAVAVHLGALSVLVAASLTVVHRRRRFGDSGAMVAAVVD
jgi:hypothetical protein